MIRLKEFTYSTILPQLRTVKDWVNSHERSTIKIAVPEKEGFSLRKFWAFAGPGVLISMAYIDPGNFATDIQAGAQFNYSMIWVIIFSTVLGLCLQILASRLGMTTGKHLATICREEYGDKSPLTITIWLITETVIVASDIPEIVGTAFALNLLFGIPLWAGVLITSIDTLLFLGIQHFGIRYLELFIGSLVTIISLAFIVETWISPVHFKTADCPSDWCSQFPEGKCPSNYCGLFWSGFIPIIHQDGLYDALALFGSVVMPHNLYLHSALVLSRDVKPNKRAIKEANLCSLIESAFALGMSAVVNVCILSVAAANFYPNASNEYSTEYSNPDLSDTSVLLGNFLGPAASIVFGIALLASGQSSTLTGTYAGQFVMEGFIKIKMPLWKRNLITRSFAILPSLIISIISGNSGSSTLIILCSVILSFQLPFALIPLVKFTSSPMKMGPFANSPLVTGSMIILGLLVSAANVFLIWDTFYDPTNGGFITLIDSYAGYVAATTALVVVSIVYFGLLGYLCFKPIRFAEERFSRQKYTFSEHETKNQNSDKIQYLFEEEDQD